MDSGALKADLAIVVPSHGRDRLVHDLLLSLGEVVARANDAGLDTCVLVIDDSEEPSLTKIKHSCNALNAHYIRGPQKVGAKRNLGAKLTEATVVLFIDSDCRAATPDLALEHWAVHADHPEAIAVAGGTEFDEPASFAQAVPTLSHVYEAFTAPFRQTTLAWATTSNLSVKRDDFLRIGGFDETIVTVVGGEDVDLGLRINELGRVVKSAPNAIVKHTAETTIREAAKKLQRYGQADGWLRRRYPHSRARTLNPVVGALAAVTLGILTGRKAAAAFVASAIIASDVVGEVRRRRPLHNNASTGALACSAGLDILYDAGIVVDAFLSRRPSSVLSEFRY